MRARRQWLLGALALSLAGCGFGAVAPTPTELDLGAPPLQSGPPVSWQFTAISLPAFGQAKLLEHHDVIWRVGVDGAPNRYATFRWRAAPVRLVRERLFERLSLHGAVLAQTLSPTMPELRVTLMQFEQVYAPDGASNESVITLQAVLVRDGQVLGHFLGTETQAAAANTAPAGAIALRTATDRLLGRLMQWLATELN